jgi:uncharacterized protein YndB with AHSA1/START domain
MTMVTMDHSVLINRPVEDVFGFVADQANEPKWHTDVLEVHPAKALEKGATVTWVVRFMGKSSYLNEVRAFEPPHRIQIAAVDGPLRPILTHTFEDVNGATLYRRHVEIPPRGLFRLVAPIMELTGAAARRNRRFTENLRRLLEAGPPPKRPT